MAKKGKAKISKVKRNNQTTNKMKKKGLLKLQRHKMKPQKQRLPVNEAVEYSSDSDKESGDEWKDMLDEEEQQYIVSRLSKQPGLLSNVPENEPAQHHQSKKRKHQDKPPKPAKVGSDSGAESYEGSDSEVEEKYEQEQSERPVKKMRSLLPIKTKEGLQQRSVECDDTESESDTEQPGKKIKEKTPEPEEEGSESDSGLEATESHEEPQKEDGVVTAVQLMAARRDRLKHEKLRIGALCSSLLEEPEKKLKNLYAILYLMEEKLKDGTLNLHSVRKLATLSTCEVFKDILPDYQIRHQDYSNVKLKKDTLSLYKYEKELLEFYKRYLQRLEKAAMFLRKKKGDTRKLDAPTLELAFVSLRCLSGLLSARPHFNYATNIAQSVVPFLDSGHEEARATVTEACMEVFKDDNKGDITLVIVRLINQLVKRKGERLHPASLDCLLSLRIRDVDLDEELEIQTKKKQEEKHKKRIVNLSKKEKKRAKKLKEVERELLETEAHESEAARKKQLTEVTKTVFHIYFRLLKTAPRSKLLATALTGLAKFTHVINLDYYSDLVAILNRLISDELVGARERLLCARTALAVLSGAGDALNVDPATFHNYLYVSALNVHAGHTHQDSKIVLESVQQVIARARRVSANVLQALAKRLATMATNTQHNAAIASLTLLYQLVQQSKPVSSLLELDSEVAGSGSYAALAPSAEQCGAHAARLHELVALRRHYHPGVRQMANALSRNPVTLPKEFHKMTAGRIFDEYDGSKMAFKPAINHTANKT